MVLTVKAPSERNRTAMTRRDALSYLAGVGCVAVLRGNVALAQGESGRLSTRLSKWQPPRVHGVIPIGGVNVYYEEQGEGVPIVLTPGGRQAALVTRPLAAGLARKYRVTKCRLSQRSSMISSSRRKRRPSPEGCPRAFHADPWLVG